MRHAQISPASAETWRRHVPPRPLTTKSAAVARALGYTLAAGDDAAPAPLLDASLIELLNDAACGTEAAADPAAPTLQPCSPCNDAACGTEAAGGGAAAGSGAAGGGGAGGGGENTPQHDGAAPHKGGGHKGGGRRVVPVVIAPGSDGELLPFGALGAALEAAAVPLLGLRLTADVPRDSFAHAAAAYVAPLVTRLAAMRADGAVLAGMSSGGGLAYELVRARVRVRVRVRVKTRV